MIFHCGDQSVNVLRGSDRRVCGKSTADILYGSKTAGALSRFFTCSADFNNA
jgi:hypothetical protein